MQEKKELQREAPTQPRDYTMFGNRRVVFVIIAIPIFLLSLCVARQLRAGSLWRGGATAVETFTWTKFGGEMCCKCFFMLFPMYEIWILLFRKNEKAEHYVSEFWFSTLFVLFVHKFNC